MARRTTNSESLFHSYTRKNARKRVPRKTAGPPPANDLKTELEGLPRIDQIYFAAARLFHEKGYDGTTMDEIAAAIGVTKATIYHFTNSGKQDLLFGIISYGMDTLDRAVIEPAHAIKDAETRLRAIINNHVKLVVEGTMTTGGNPVTVVVDEVGGLSPAQRRGIDARKRAYVDLIRQTLEQLQAEGKLKEVDVTAVAFNLLGMIMWLARWYRPNGRLNADAIAAEVTKMALGGILRTKPRAARK